MLYVKVSNKDERKSKVQGTSEAYVPHQNCQRLNQCIRSTTSEITL